MTPRRKVSIAAGAALALLLTIVVSGGEGPPVTVEIPAGSTLPEVAEILDSLEVVGSGRLFHAYVRIRGADRELKAGTYLIPTGSSMRGALGRLTRGEVETVTFTIQEGLMLQQIVPRIAELTGASSEEVSAYIASPELVERYDLPGPTMEGYLFPDTYRFAQGVPVASVVDAMVGRYQALWTDDRRAALARSGRSENEIVTLASIVQAEARQVEEMPRIAGVYDNRLEADWLLQADPTVLYALGGYRARLLYAAIDSVEGNPYNTYSVRGLPPGPIGAPGERAIDAALSPEEHEFMFFVAWPDGSHVFTNSLAAHNEAKEEARRARETIGS